jgi:lysophospholipid acyltransferase (LPLAT)-like uncharacterized protein
MKKLKRILTESLSSSLVTLLLVTLIRIIYATMRITVIGKEILPGFAARGEGYVGAFWHGRILMIPFLYPGTALHILVSKHRDAEIIASILSRFGFQLIRGSSSKGGSDALRGMLRLLRDDNDLGIAADGPRGPAEVLKPGAAQLGRLSGKAVIPISFSASRSLRFGSWDRFMFPLPFSRGAFVVGKPLRAADGEENEAFRLRIENALNEATAMADALVGVTGLSVENDGEGCL